MLPRSLLSERVLHAIKRAAAKTGSPRLTHRSLERGLRVLEAAAAVGGLTTLSEMARRTGLHRSTAHHLMRTLVSLGYLDQDAGTRGYQLSAKLFRLTGRTWTSAQLGQIAEPFVAALAARTGDGASFAAYRNGIVTIAAKFDSQGPVRVVQDVGSRRPLNATAVAKAILAFLPEHEVAALVRRARFERFTPNTITGRAAFLAELRRVRAAGAAIDDEEHIEGIRCIAAPVFGYDGQVLGSLCAVGPKSRMTHEKLRRLRAPLLEQARALSKRLDWETPIDGNG
jgi:IclR family acetate operon transcriptional repressor